MARIGHRQGLDGTSRSPRRMERARLVTSDTTFGQASSSVARAAPAGSRCSKLSSTSRSRLACNRAARRYRQCAIIPWLYVEPVRERLEHERGVLHGAGRAAKTAPSGKSDSGAICRGEGQAGLAPHRQGLSASPGAGGSPGSVGAGSQQVGQVSELLVATEQRRQRHRQPGKHGQTQRRGAAGARAAPRCPSRKAARSSPARASASANRNSVSR